MSGFLLVIAGLVADSGEHAAGDMPFTPALGFGQVAGALTPSDADRQQDESAEDSAAEKDSDREDDNRDVHGVTSFPWWCRQMATARYSTGPNERVAT